MSMIDLAILSKHLMENFPHYYKYFSIKGFKYNNIFQPNRNRLLRTYTGVDGLKTGHTEAGGYGMAVSSLMGGRRLIAIVNGATSELDRENDVVKLLNYGFKLKRFKLYERGEIIEELPVLYGRENAVARIITDDDVYGWGTDRDSIEPNIIIYREMVAPLKKDERIGEIILNDKSFNLVMQNNVRSVNWVRRIWIKFKNKVFQN
jgi:D-alanyl-D-alanine carboxypeptidase (penicillin-binding protein 5/6)